MPHFDVIHLGVGADAHTASLFPGEPLIEDREKIVAAVPVPKLSAHRITLLPGVLLSSKGLCISFGLKSIATLPKIEDRFVGYQR